MQFADLTIVESSVAQARQSRVNTFTTWGEGLGFNENEWVSRFETLEQGPWAEGDRYKCWALVPRNDPTTLNMLAHCETFRRPSLTATNGSTKTSLSYGIAAVFTPHQQRAHGYARQLLRLLHYVMAPTDLLPPFPSHWGPAPKIPGFKDASFSVLYSGVGDKYYASCRRGDGEASEPGWEREKVTSRTWTVPSGTDSAEAIGEFIGFDELRKYEAKTSQTMQSEFGDREGDVRVAILPEENLFQIHAKRYLLSPAYKSRPSRHFGFALKENSAQGAPFIIYTFPESGKDSQTLEVLHVQQPFPFDALMAAARAEDCTKVKLWIQTGDWDTHNPKLDSDAEMPCLVVYDGKTSQTKWQWVEQYTWC